MEVDDNHVMKEAEVADKLVEEGGMLLEQADRPADVADAFVVVADMLEEAAVVE